MNLDTIIIVVSAIVQVIVLICFLILCSNVTKIRKKLIISDNFSGMFAMYITIGDKEKARELLYQKISKEPEFFAAFCYNGNNSSQRTILEKKYKPYFEALNINLDFDSADKFIQMIEQ